MSTAPAMATRRLRRELLALQSDPLPDMIASPDETDILTWYYALKGPEGTPYESGIYVGKLRFPPSYPMSPPAVYMLTPSGRFQCNTRLCLSMSDFHPESWSPMWNVGTLLQGIVSFMTSEEHTTGAMQATEAHRRDLAAQSHAQHFGHLFGGDMEAAFAQATVALKKATSDRIAKEESNAKKRQTE